MSSLATSTGTQLTKEHCSPVLSPAPAQAPATLFNSLVCDGYTANCAHNKHMCKLLASSLPALNTQTIVCLFQPVTWQAILNIGHQYPFPALQPFPALTMILIMYSLAWDFCVLGSPRFLIIPQSWTAGIIYRLSGHFFTECPSI